MSFYWLLTTYDDKKFKVPPEQVANVQRRMQNREPINFRTSSVPPGQVKSFDMTDEPYGQQPLLDAVSQAFHEPVYADDGSIVVRWVKKLVTQHKWDKFYGVSPGYKRLGDENGMIVVAFRLPVHQIDPDKVAYCTEDEVIKLTSQLS